MSETTTTPNDPPAGGDIDRLLTEFFRRELPDPWPAAPAVALASASARTSPAGSSAPARSGRWALAFSLAAVTILGVALAGRMPAPRGGPFPSVETGNATVPTNLRSK